ncbi:hypothetical protein GCU60_14565 [Blastococcus saxobsidens]|uniref:Uncharacterized protein n=1 Tax=Blastococcus saxobsidens TaxID=138336 RepID=A0A6L9W4H6_9ACTN|nr:hypothetical protein [Blastococcus saxobsidens]NEK86965.1 hypothetical protein [Blastococcus saxobsidens]
MESRPPGLVVEHSDSWAYFPPDWEQQGSWREATRHLRHPFTSRARTKSFTRWWAPVLENAVATGCVGVFLHAGFRGLLEQPDLVVRLVRHEHDPAVPAAQAIDEVLRNALRPDDPRLAPPVIEPVPGSDVGAVRVRQRVGGRRWAKVQEHVRWLVPVAGVVWELSTSSTGRVEDMERRLPKIDALVNGMRDPMRNADVPFVVLRPEMTAAGGLLVRDIPHSSLTIDREGGEVIWEDDAVRQRRVELPLGTGPGEVAGLLRASYPPVKAGHPRIPDVFRLMLVDDSGRVVARSAAWAAAYMDKMWPVELLETSGLPVQTRRFSNTRLLNKAHPGAAPLWVFSGGLWLLMLWALLGAVVVLAVGGLLAGNPIWSDWSGFLGPLWPDWSDFFGR